MELSLKEACSKIRKEFILNTEYDKAVAILLEFCQSVLECEGMPQKLNNEQLGAEAELFSTGFNRACDLWQAYIAKMLGKITPERLHEFYLEAIINLHPESYNPKAQKCYNHLTDEQKAIDIYIASAIVAGLKEGK